MNNEITDNNSSAILRQGKLFNESQTESKKKSEQEGFTMPDISSLGARDSGDTSNLNPHQYVDDTGKTTKYSSAFNSEYISRFGESINPFSQKGTVPSLTSWEQSKALQDTNNLLSKSNDLIRNEVKALKKLETEYDKVINEYNQTKEDLMGVVDEYADKVVSDSNINTNVFVSSLVDNPKEEYLGCYNNNSFNFFGNSYNTWNYAFGTTGTNLTMDECKQSAQTLGYTYFGMQKNTGDGTAKCMLGNSLQKSVNYGDASNLRTSKAIWSSNTAGKNGVSMKITDEGNMVLTDGGGNIIWQTPVVDSCKQVYSVTDNTGSPGNDLGYNSNVSLDQCKELCDDLDSCRLFEWSKGSNSCWLKSSIAQRRQEWYRTGRWWRRRWASRWVGGTTSNSDRALYTKTRDLSDCVFRLVLQDDGNMVIYRVNGGPAIWATNTNSQQGDPNPDRAAGNGKYGVNTIYTDQGLSPGEWLGSNDGSLCLLMQNDGNLVLYTTETKNKCTKQGDITYGDTEVNAVYKLTPKGDPSVIGKMGYIDEEKKLSEYSSDNIELQRSPNYKVMPNNYTRGGPNGWSLGSMGGVPVEKCKEECNDNKECYGFVYDNRNEANTCYFMDKTMYPMSKRYFLKDVDLYYNAPKVANNRTCGNTVNMIDSLEWNRYKKTNVSMTRDTKCGLASATSRQRWRNNYFQRKLAGITDKIVEKLKYLESLNVDMTDQMGIDLDVLKEDMDKYTALHEKYNALLADSDEMVNIAGILDDSDILVLQENYSYLMWTIVATALVIITINQMNN